MKMLVTGGAGLIGSYLIETLLKNKHEVSVIDNLSRGKKEHIPINCEFICGDVGNLSDVLNKKFDVIFHLASFMFGLGFSNKYHSLLYEENNKITDGLIKYIADHTPNKVIFVSSSCVYSDEGSLVVDEFTPLGRFPERANLGYAYAKRHTEDRLAMAAHCYKFDLKIARPFNIYAERYRWIGDKSQAIPMLVNKIMTQKTVEVWGSGQQARTYIHAEDCAEILAHMGEADSDLVPEILNIGHEKIITLNALTLKLAALAKRTISIVNLTDKPEGRKIKSCTSTEVLKTMNRNPYKISLSEGLEKMIEWWKAEIREKNE